jgi:hypothetical protein
MTFAFVLTAFVVAVAIVGALFSIKQSRSSGNWPFYARKLLSAPEQVLYHRLVKALPDLLILAQVQVSRVLGVRKGYDLYDVEAGDILRRHPAVPISARHQHSVRTEKSVRIAWSGRSTNKAKLR